MRRWRCTPLVRNRAETQWGLGGSRQKEYRRVAGVSTRRFDEAETKKHEPSLKKLTFCPRACWSDVISKIVVKIKDLLVTSIKMASPDRDDRDQSRDVRRSHLPLKLKPLGAGGLWRAMVQLFYCFLTCGVVCEIECLLSERRREERRSIRPLVYVHKICRWFLMNFQLGVLFF